MFPYKTKTINDSVIVRWRGGAKHMQVLEFLNLGVSAGGLNAIRLAGIDEAEALHRFLGEVLKNPGLEKETL